MGNSKINDEARRLLQQLRDSGETVEAIAEAFGINEKTVRRITTNNKKGLVKVIGEPTRPDDENIDTYGVSMSEDTTEGSPKSSLQDDKRGRHFWYVVYPSKEWYEQYYETHKADCDADGVVRPHYEGQDGYGTAPDDWQEELRQTGLAFCMSPLHDRDMTSDEDGRAIPKKPHWHVIVSWGNTTTYRNARSLCEWLHCPRPQILKNVTGAYRYHQHLDDPDKYQYEEASQAVNGWERPLDTAEVSKIMMELSYVVAAENIIEYGELVMTTPLYGPEYSDVVNNHTMFFRGLCESMWRNPLRVLHRALRSAPDEYKEAIEANIKQYQQMEDEDYEM